MICCFFVDNTPKKIRQKYGTLALCQTVLDPFLSWFFSVILRGHSKRVASCRTSIFVLHGVKKCNHAGQSRRIPEVSVTVSGQKINRRYGSPTKLTLVFSEPVRQGGACARLVVGTSTLYCNATIQGCGSPLQFGPTPR